jgi:hypothetical protein
MGVQTRGPAWHAKQPSSATNAVEDNGPGTFRQMISTQACDFRQKDWSGFNGPLVSNGVSTALYYGVATPFVSATRIDCQTNLLHQHAQLAARSNAIVFVQSNTCNAVMNEIPASPFP